MDRVLIWGIGCHCDRLINNIMYEVVTGNIEIVAFVSRDIPVYHKLDGKPIIKPQQIKDTAYDYIIVTSSFYNEIFNEATKVLNIPAEVIIDGKVLNIPLFSWKRYIQVKSKKIGIISESCYGGYIYHIMHLPFTSPFINMRIYQYDYLRLLENLDYYLQQPITMERDVLPANDLYRNIAPADVVRGVEGHPIINLGDIPIHAIHAPSYEQFRQDWQRRIARLDRNNLIVLMVIENDEIAERFHNIPLKNKIGFYYKETNYDDIICLKEYNNSALRLKCYYNFRTYVHRLINANEIKTIDILKLVNGEKDYIRIQE